MKNAIIVHGKPTQERYENPDEPKPHVANWFPWIKQELVSRGVNAVVPKLPTPYFPVYTDWKKLIEKEPVNSETALIGHSAGAEFILRWMSEHPETSVERVVLLAPYKDYYCKYGEFSEYTLDPALVARAGRLSILHSNDDDLPIRQRADELATSLPDARHVELSGYGHFRIGHNMQSAELPVLLAELYRD